MRTPTALQPLIDATPHLGDAEALRGFAVERGYLHFKNFAPIELIEALRAEVRAFCVESGLAVEVENNPAWVEARPGATLEGMVYEDPRWMALQRRLYTVGSFRALGDHPALLAVLEALYGEPPMSGRGDICRISMPDSLHQTTCSHQDHFFVGGSTEIWTVWFPLVDCPLSQGPVAVSPASHRRGFLQHGEGYEGVEVPEATTWAASPLSPGDVLLFHCFTIHKALPNRSSSRIRLSVDFRYQPPSHPLSSERVAVKHPRKT